MTRRYISYPVDLQTGDCATVFMPQDLTRAEWARIIAAMNAYLAVPPARTPRAIMDDTRQPAGLERV